MTGKQTRSTARKATPAPVRPTAVQPPPGPHVAVLGAGNWGTTIAHLIASNGNAVRLWTRSSELADAIRTERVNRRYLDGFDLSEHIWPTNDLALAVRGARMIVMVIPSSGFRAVCRQLAPLVEPDQAIVHATKGLEQHTYRRMSQIVLEETCVRRYAVISGPNIAREIMEGKPSGTVVASPFPRLIERVSGLLTGPTFRVYTNDDVAGVELGGALKNIIAIGAGISAGLQLGENTRALLITRGLGEIMRLSLSFGARAETFSGLAGIGDLMVTCASEHSRNFRLGRGLAAGKDVATITAQLGMVAEGVNTVAVAHDFVREHNVYAPVIEAIHAIVHGGQHPIEAIRELMVLDARPDVDLG